MRGTSRGVPLTKQKSATARERELAEDAHDLIMLFRELVQRSPKASAELRKAMSVGEPLNPAVTQRVIDGLTAVAANAVALRACGAGEADIDEAARLATELAAADRGQSASMRERASATDSNVALLLRVQQLIESIAMAGKLAFRKNKQIRERFEALLAPPSTTTRGGGGGDGGETPDDIPGSGGDYAPGAGNADGQDAESGPTV